MILAAILFATATELSHRLTSAAEELLKIEKKIAGSNEGLDAILYDDVLSLLDQAIDVDPQNLRAHARASEVLLLKSNNGDRTFDVCTILDARDEADYVLKHGGAGEDAAIARATVRGIERIPAAA